MNRRFVACPIELERRALLAPILVTTAEDDGLGTVSGSLSWAIIQANADPDPDPAVIDFNIPGTGPFTISPTSPLPPLYHSVTIDGYSQPGASPNTEANTDNASIQIVLSGANTNGDGLADFAYSARSPTSMIVCGYPFRRRRR